MRHSGLTIRTTLDIVDYPGSSGRRNTLRGGCDLHYLKAAEAAGTDQGVQVMAKMRELPIRDFFARNARLREDGRMVHDMYLAQVKTPAESKGSWDFYKILKTIPGEEAFQPLSESTCKLVKK